MNRQEMIDVAATEIVPTQYNPSPKIYSVFFDCPVCGASIPVDEAGIIHHFCNEEDEQYYK